MQLYVCPLRLLTSELTLWCKAKNKVLVNESGVIYRLYINVTVLVSQAQFRELPSQYVGSFCAFLYNRVRKNSNPPDGFRKKSHLWHFMYLNMPVVQDRGARLCNCAPALIFNTFRKTFHVIGICAAPPSFSIRRFHWNGANINTTMIWNWICDSWH